MKRPPNFFRPHAVGRVTVASQARMNAGSILLQGLGSVRAAGAVGRHESRTGGLIGARSVDPRPVTSQRRVCEGWNRTRMGRDGRDGRVGRTDGGTRERVREGEGAAGLKWEVGEHQVGWTADENPRRPSPNTATTSAWRGRAGLASGE